MKFNKKVASGICVLVAIAALLLSMNCTGRPKIKGEIIITLNEEKAPITVGNFKKYVEKGYYDNTIFHRVIAGFVVQGGGFTEDMTQKETDAPIKNEASNGLSNKTGTVAMARTQIVDSATSQFFINLSDNSMLNHRDTTDQGFGYCVFGEVTSGMELVKEIALVNTGTSGFHRDVPTQPVVVTKVVMDESGTKAIFTVEQK